MRYLIDSYIAQESRGGIPRQKVKRTVVDLIDDEAAKARAAAMRWPTKVYRLTEVSGDNTGGDI